MRKSRIKNNLKFFAAGAVLSALVATLVFEVLYHPEVKMSPRGYCHTVDSPYYVQTFNFNSFPSLKSCLQSGGIEPERSK